MSTAQAVVDPTLKCLREFFGEDALLIPLDQNGAPSPLPPMPQQNRNDKWLGDYERVLRTSDIGISLGSPGTLCTLRFASLEEQQAFAQLNPQLKTLITRHTEGDLHWLNIIDSQLPETQRYPEAWWQSSGWVKLLDRPNGKFCCAMVAKAPIYEARLGAINWPGTMSKAFLPSIIASDYGLPSKTHPYGKITINLLFFAKYFAEDATVRYFESAKTFHYLDPSIDQIVQVEPGRLKHFLARFLMRIQGIFPNIDLFTLAQPKGLDRLEKALRIVASTPAPEQEDLMITFLDQVIVSYTGGTATSDELFQEFCRFCAARNVAPMSRRLFDRTIGPVLRDRFSVSRTHSLVRDGSWRRGYRNIRVASRCRSDFGTLGTLGHDVMNIQNSLCPS